MTVSLFFLLALAFIGCASSSPQTDAYLLKNHLISKSYQIENMPFIEQSAGYCGPATLAMALQFSGKNISEQEVAAQVFTPGMKGTLQSDMISASRRQGMLAIPIQGLEALLTEVSSGHPVIVFENLALNWLPQWHYALVFGYDLSQQIVTMHSGPEAFKHWDLRKFERSWKLADYWGLVVLPPGQLSATANELNHAKAAAALEQLGKLDEADISYQVILKRWPESLTAGIGASNIAFTKKNPNEAERILKKTILFHPTSAACWHNLAIALGTNKKTKEAKESAKQALKWATEEEKKSFLANLKPWLD